MYEWKYKTLYNENTSENTASVFYFVQASMC